MKKLILLFAFFLVSANLLAQQTVGTEVEMADAMRSNGKIYVVAGVFALVMLGLFAYLIRLDGKIGRLEKTLRK